MTSCRKLLECLQEAPLQLTRVRIDQIIDATLEIFRPQMMFHGIRVERTTAVFRRRFRPTSRKSRQIFHESLPQCSP